MRRARSSCRAEEVGEGENSVIEAQNHSLFLKPRKVSDFPLDKMRNLLNGRGCNAAEVSVAISARKIAQRNRFTFVDRSEI
jgi:hypothetical protein